MTVVVAPPCLTDAARRDWDLLQAPTPDPAAFDPEMAGMLPEPARSWVLHAIAPGTPLRRAVVLDSHGVIRLNGWHPYRAAQVLLPPEGFVWSAGALFGPLTVRGFDRYRDGTGEMRWRLFDAVPVMSGTGPDITRSAAGRLASELVLAPAAALDPRLTWKQVDERRAAVRVPVAGEEHEVTLTVAPGGALEAVSLSRWGAPEGGPYRHEPFGVEVLREETFGGYTIAAEARGGWWPGTARWAEGEFIRFSIERAVFR
ncbi:hypothetical protein GCM10010149_71120 [Nonomuraea roseoviolacea subsp. roseoviolacea]|uniref:Uncharacterized protein n=1 Tax=Nonomuraea roseoviolacea subsp. carminata TaxID=160689 RepID=A0ABT1K7V9_9ACTN|nr:DUF6544 family protein [Nonomuraea roseoviolacea]MCP2350078.1 hypothetical protein [Nonomuraea roseoviolacea subsp. carminata]